MIQLLYVLLMLLLLSCQNSNRQIIPLYNSLGVAEFLLPEKFDTIYTWEDIGDHSCGDYYKIRIANRNYSLLAETGWLYDKFPDSLYQITIIQNKNPLCDHKRAPRPRQPEDWIRQEVENRKASDPETIIKEAGIKNISGYEFAILTMEDPRKNKQNIEVYAIGEVNDQFLVIQSECLSSSNCNSFGDIIHEILNDLEILHDPEK